MKNSVKELIADRRSLKEAVIAAVIFPVVYFGVHLIGWGNEMFSWWQALLAAPIFGLFYWLFTSGFRRFANEDVTPRR